MLHWSLLLLVLVFVLVLVVRFFKVQLGTTLAILNLQASVSTCGLLAWRGPYACILCVGAHPPQETPRCKTKGPGDV